MKLEESVAVVVGIANGGVGTAICQQLLEHGTKVCGGDVQDAKGKLEIERLQQKYGTDVIIFVKCNVRDQSEVENLFKTAVETFGQVDIVCNTAGILNEFNWESCVDVNLGGVIRLSKEALKYMSKDNGGSGGVIIHTSSIGGLYPVVWSPVYAATKWAVVGYVRSWAESDNFKSTGVRFNTVCSGTVDTKFLDLVSPDTVFMPRDVIDSITFKFKPCDVAKEFIKMIEDDSTNGVALEVLEDGIRPHDFGSATWEFK